MGLSGLPGFRTGGGAKLRLAHAKSGGQFTSFLGQIRQDALI